MKRPVHVSLSPWSFAGSKAVLPARQHLSGTLVAIAGSSCLIPFDRSFDRGSRLRNVGLKDFGDWAILQMNQQILTPPCCDGICLLHREAADFCVTCLN